LLQVSPHLVRCWLLFCCILLLLCLGIGLEILIFPRHFTRRCVVFCQMPFQHLMRRACGFFLWDCLYSGLLWWISGCGTFPAIPGMKPTWPWCIFILMWPWIQFARIFNIFAWIFIREIGLKLSFFVGFLCGLHIKKL